MNFYDKSLDLVAGNEWSKATSHKSKIVDSFYLTTIGQSKLTID